MNRHVNSIAGRLSLRPPQRRSLEILDRITEIIPPNKEVDLSDSLAVIKNEFSTVTDFERDFPSLCFALATGVGKTRLMGAFISYLNVECGCRGKNPECPICGGEGWYPAVTTGVCEVCQGRGGKPCPHCGGDSKIQLREKAIGFIRR